MLSMPFIYLVDKSFLQFVVINIHRMIFFVLDKTSSPDNICRQKKETEN
jgi:hypothetical protein